MHVVVMGAGVVGVTTAWYLRQQGHDVTVVCTENPIRIDWGRESPKVSTQ